MRLTRRWRLLIVLMVLGAGQASADHFGLDVGLNFTSSTYGVNDWFIPPDTMGAVGNDRIVELINGRYAVYNKSTGALVASSSLNAFWTNAGAGWGGSFTFDPRVLYDPFTERWFAASVDNPGGANSFLIAVSSSSDPSAGWTGFAIDADSDDSHWADFPTLGFDADGVYIAANMVLVNVIDSTTLLAIPKADLVAATPTVANATIWENINPNNSTGLSVQPIVDMDNTGLPARFLSAYNTGSGWFKRVSITGSIMSPVLDTEPWPGGFISVTAYGYPPDADQPGPKQDIETNDPRICSNAILRNGSLWAVQCVGYNGRAALRWLEIDESTNALLQEGLIADSELHYYFPSIAVNPYDMVVIGCSGSSASQYVSTYAVLGETSGSGTTFGAPVLLVAGVDDYQRLDTSNRNRWGDYSAAVLDPQDPFTFWTFQEWCSNDNVWATRITQLDSRNDPTVVSLAGVRTSSRPEGITLHFSYVDPRPLAEFRIYHRSQTGGHVALGALPYAGPDVDYAFLDVGHRSGPVQYRIVGVGVTGEARLLWPPVPRTSSMPFRAATLGHPPLPPPTRARPGRHGA